MPVNDKGKDKIEKKYRRLVRILKRLPGAVVAFSGGVDSSVLLWAARDALGKKVLAVTARSPLYPKRETALARRICRRIGVRHLVFESHELNLPQFRRNPLNRCYHCKRELFAFMKRIAGPQGYAVIEGGNRSDRNDFRPGSIAGRRLQVLSPLAQAGLGKSEIRLLARRFKLPNWDKPALACLASRIPYGRTIDQVSLKRIGAAESFLVRLGLTQIRVRDHLPVARIEVDPAEFGLVMRARERIVRRFLKLGYKHVALDLSGYQTGSMNL